MAKYSGYNFITFLLAMSPNNMNGDFTKNLPNQGCLNYPNTNRLSPIIPTIYSQANGVIPQNAPFTWICQKLIVQNADVQYITLYDIDNNLPVYSVYKAKPWTKDPTSGVWKKTPRNRPKWESQQINGGNLIINGVGLASVDDYKGEKKRSLVDRGHLFAAQFASDPEQYKATFKISNIVPQDSIFNSEVWGRAETILIDNAMQHCQIASGIPLVVTGAVSENQAAVHAYFNIQPQAPGRRPLMVPVLLWTTMWCMDTNNVPQYHVSFIGDNGSTGQVMFYKQFQAFQEELVGMYGQNNIGGGALPWSNNPLPQDLDQNNNLFVDINAAINGATELKWALKTNQEQWRSAFRMQRKEYLVQFLIDNLERMGINVGNVNIAGNLKDTLGNLNRKKRSTSMSTKTPGNTSMAMLTILDNDVNADFRFTKCSFIEEDLATKATQKHEIDLENKKLIESPDETGSDLTGSFRTNDGKMKEMQKEDSKERKIRIVLKPRDA